jgi:hypothetical protein
MPRPHRTVSLAALLAALALLLASACGTRSSLDAVPLPEAGAGDAGPCGPGTALCGTTCTVLAFDPGNCGACGVKCASGQACSGGKCGLDCNGGTERCQDACVDTRNDPANCGGCGKACPLGQVCSAGKCDLFCQGGTTKCNNLCVDTGSDPANCGQCGNKCPMGYVCNQGACDTMCSGGTTQCGQACVDPAVDPKHCGQCGNACPSGEVCSGGKCSQSCTGGLVRCGNFCVDTASDPKNCGQCGFVCSGTDKCVAGKCVACDSSTTDCDGDGWLASEGDCCDKPGACGAEPKLVNPGAIEVVGNGIDDNCNGAVDLFDQADTQPCDLGLASDTTDAIDFAKALGLCRRTQQNPPQKKDRTWGLISAQLLRADGTPLGDRSGHSIRSKFGAQILPLNGSSMVVLSSGRAADATQTNPGPNGGAPAGSNVTYEFFPSSQVDIASCSSPLCVKDWLGTANPPLKAAGQLPQAPMCGNISNPSTAHDSVMLVLTMRAPTNARAFSFNSYFFSAEYPEFVCSNFNDQYIALVDTPTGTPQPIPNPVDKNLMTFTQGGQKWPVAINIAAGTSVFSVCDAASKTGACQGTQVSMLSCGQGAAGLAGTGFDKPTSATCLVGGGTYWLTTAGNVVPGQLLQLRIAIWDVSDAEYDSTALLDGFQWLANATLPGTTN